ncbi:MAG: FliH/SctL family protein [Desulfuromonadaceae bacterium]|nr:FliH/SctL family protein [Desulfuromonadaceae bacterium]MDD2855203.1 FliH/SctL family protein [Desulfuromonadaceae bacterium]
MSSSKIIKLADNNKTEVSEFSFNNIGHFGLPERDKQSLGGFVPMGLYHPEQEEQDVDAGDLGPPPIEISEEELEQRLNSSFNEGLKEGKELAERGLVNVFRALRASTEKIHNLRDKILRESEDELITLIMQVARKVIIREVTEDRSILSSVVKNALDSLSAREEITVRINPDDYLLVTTGRDEILSKELLSELLQLKSDPTVAAGFCLVDTAMGTVDASLDAQLEQLYRTLLEQRTTHSVAES